MNRKKHSQIDEVEIQRLEYLKKINLDFNNAWHDKEYLENLPTKLFKEPDINHSNLPKGKEVFFRITNGYLIIDEKLYKILSQFNLGKTHFSQVYIYDIETKERLSDKPYYFINIAEKFESLDVENSKQISSNRYYPHIKQKYIDDPKDDDIVLLLQAKDNMIDLWHDPLLNKSLFFSDRLVQTLFEAGFTQQELGLIRCIVK